jgi:hypothetical protein
MLGIVLMEQKNFMPPATNQPERKNVRLAMTLNFLLPGIGQFYLGQRLFGFSLAAGFLACFVAMLGIFSYGYREYLNIATSDDILQSGFLERIGSVFHIGWLVGLLVLSVVIFIVSLVDLSLRARRLAPDSDKRSKV